MLNYFHRATSWYVLPQCACECLIGAVFAAGKSQYDVLYLELHLRLQVSRRASLLLALLAGISLSVLAAGFFLSRRRRRYRAISATSLDATSKRNSSGHAALSRSSTFRDVSEDSRQRYFLRTSGRDMTGTQATVTHWHTDTLLEYTYCRRKAGLGWSLVCPCTVYIY